SPRAWAGESRARAAGLFRRTHLPATGSGGPLPCPLGTGRVRGGGLRPDADGGGGARVAAVTLPVDFARSGHGEGAEAGRGRGTGNAVGGQPSRGFESHPLRQLSKLPSGEPSAGPGAKTPSPGACPTSD